MPPPHGIDDWYVGPALISYHFPTIFIWETRVLRIINTLTWFPRKVKLPDIYSTEITLSLQ